MNAAGASSFSNAYFGQGSGPILLKNVGCSGSERALIDCTHDPIGELGVCSHSDDAGVSCRSRKCQVPSLVPRLSLLPRNNSTYDLWPARRKSG